MAGFGGGSLRQHRLPGHATAGRSATINDPVLIGVQDFTSGASGLRRRDRQGRPGRQRGDGLAQRATTLRSSPFRAATTIPLRTPFALTGSATDEDGDPIYYSWEQNDPGIGAGISLLNNTKANGPLFAMFPLSAPVTEEDTLLYNSPHENHVTTSPTRVFPDLDQILANNTNADTGSCAAGPDRAAGADSGQGVLLRVPADLRLHAERAALPSARRATSAVRRATASAT